MKIKKVNISKSIATVLGISLLLGGIGAGVVLVEQPQLLEQRAQTLTYTLSECPLFTPRECVKKTNTKVTCLHSYSSTITIATLTCPAILTRKCIYNKYSSKSCSSSTCQFTSYEYGSDWSLYCSILTKVKKDQSKPTQICFEDQNCIDLMFDKGFKCHKADATLSTTSYCEKSN